MYNLLAPSPLRCHCVCVSVGSLADPGRSGLAGGGPAPVPTKLRSRRPRPVWRTWREAGRSPAPLPNYAHGDAPTRDACNALRAQVTACARPHSRSKLLGAMPRANKERFQGRCLTFNTSNLASCKQTSCAHADAACAVFVNRLVQARAGLCQTRAPAAAVTAGLGREPPPLTSVMTMAIISTIAIAITFTRISTIIIRLLHRPNRACGH